jgi:replicative DNA helicase
MQRTHLNIVATLETTIGRLPANIEAERSILGAVLLDNHAFNDAAEHLKPEDFSIDSHRRIYSRMMDLAESSRPIDIITLVEELEQKKDLQAVGDVGYISGLLDGVPDRPSIEHYVRIVRDKAILRGLINVANAAIAKASEQAEPADEILNDAESRRLSATLLARWTLCCNAGSASPGSPRTTPSLTRRPAASRRPTWSFSRRGLPWARLRSP